MIAGRFRSDDKSDQCMWQRRWAILRLATPLIQNTSLQQCGIRFIKAISVQNAATGLKLRGSDFVRAIFATIALQD